MAETYLDTAFRDREQVKALGARWDPDRKKWFVPHGRDLAPFASWLPKASTASRGLVATPERVGTELSAANAGIALSQLLAGVSQAVTRAFATGVWTRVEVVKADRRRGHVYLEVAERSSRGDLLAQARALIWSDTANVIVAAFEQATGVVLGGGIKLLVQVKPVVSALYGLSLVVEAIDPNYTLGDLEAKKREIRDRLKREGLFDVNRQLPPPWDYNAVLVASPLDGAGLGDFRAEAERLERFGICAFSYVHSRFQGEGAAAEILGALAESLARRAASGNVVPDAVVIIRGGGAVNDLAWLNDYELARYVCQLEVPVITGIGHQRDSTVLDEVANLCFDTPSKAIAGIEQTISRRAAEARASFEQVLRAATSSTVAARRCVEQAEAAVMSGAQRQLVLARSGSAGSMLEIHRRSVGAVRQRSEDVSSAMQGVRTSALRQVSHTKLAVPTVMADIRSGIRQVVRDARSGTSALLEGVTERAALDALRSRQAAEEGLRAVEVGARRTLVDARTHAESLVREIAGQGPEKALGRGFAIVRAADGSTVTGAAQAKPSQFLEIHFHDGRLVAQLGDNQEKTNS